MSSIPVAHVQWTAYSSLPVLLAIVSIYFSFLFILTLLAVTCNRLRVCLFLSRLLVCSLFFWHYVLFVSDTLEIKTIALLFHDTWLWPLYDEPWHVNKMRLKKEKKTATVCMTTTTTSTRTGRLLALDSAQTKHHHFGPNQGCSRPASVQRLGPR